jgi:hypothetical protein
VYLAYTKFINTMKQESVVEQLLPVVRKIASREDGCIWEYIYEPDAQSVIDELLVRYASPSCTRQLRKHGVRAIGAHGGHEGRYRQRRQRHQRVEAGLQQDASGSDYDRTVGNRGRRSRCVNGFNEQTDWSKKWLKYKARLFNVSAPWWTWSLPTASPKVYDALKLEGSALTLEVQQQLGDGVVRTIALGSSDGLKRGLMVTNTGNPITVPVGYPGPHHGRAGQPHRRARPVDQN